MKVIREYPKADGALLDAVRRAQNLCGMSQWDARHAAEKEVVKLCPHQIGVTAIANGATFARRPFRVTSIEVGSRPHYEAGWPTRSARSEWYWLLRGPLLLESGKASEVNSAMRYETFHVDIPPAELIPGDAGW